jgi:WD40 repeat protein
MVDAWAVTISSDGRLVTTVARGALCLWEVGESQEMKRFQLDIGDHEPDDGDDDPDITPEKYVPLSLSPNDICIAVGCRNDIFVFHSHTGLIPSSPFIGHTDIVRSIAYSTDSTHIVSCSKDHTVRVWDVSSGTCKFTFEGHTYWNTVSFSPKDTQIAVGTAWAGTIHLWTLGTTEPYVLQHKDNGAVSSLAFSQDARLLVAGPAASIHVWDLSSPQDSMKVVGYHVKGWVTSVVFFPDGKQIMSTSEDGAIRVWDGEEVAEIKSDFGGGGRWILENDKELLFWSLSGVRHPRNNLIIGPHIDLARFVHGEQWVNCRQPVAIADS